jgi:hypothetical protein
MLYEWMNECIEAWMDGTAEKLKSIWANTQLLFS